MASRRTRPPFEPAAAFGRRLHGLGINLLVADVARSVAFVRDVLDLAIGYADPDFAFVEHAGQRLFLHADHTYQANVLGGLVARGVPRGVGVELRVFGIDADAAEARARALGYEVLAAAADKPHGLRECVLRDPDGYVWVPGRACG